MARRLKTIALEINFVLGPHGYVAKIVEGYCNTDRKIPGTRLIHPGKGRRGNRLIVHKNGEVVFDHNASETYRHNSEVESWLERELERNGISDKQT